MRFSLQAVRGGSIVTPELARQSPPVFRGRKVRAPQGKVPGNAWAARADGKCNRKYTA
ncbi:hypothetical protein MSNKSG1_00091 [Marinobacter santoriniensis NKSG1]|uniref:Uncharacterized protein n=1 Tax=Marinobacter santoriniensis NKSG1 TaxID=1288826 RepID=M7CVB8_9GAMM|nr:hypothetical protein MSNKSG1_00091 [Marinobacter santoriniensis NKSG1]